MKHEVVWRNEIEIVWRNEIEKCVLSLILIENAQSEWVNALVI